MGGGAGNDKMTTLEERQQRMKERMANAHRRRGRPKKSIHAPKPARRYLTNHSSNPFHWPYRAVTIEHALEVAKSTFLAAKPEDDPFVTCNKWVILSLVKFIEGAPVEVRPAMQANLKGK